MIQTRWGHLNRGYSLLTRVQAMFLDGHLLLEQTARSRSGRFFNFNGTAGLWRRSCIDEAGGLAARHADRRSRSELSRAARRLEIHLPPGRDHPGGAAGGHERLQVAAAPLDQGLDPDLQEIASDDLAQQPTARRLRSKPRPILTSNFAYLLLACLCVLLHPSTGGPQTGWVRMLLVDVPIFLTASVSVAVFYICAQRELHPRTWMREILLLPACWRSASVSRSIMPARCLRRSSTTNRISPARRNTALSANPSRGGPANTCRSSRFFRSRRWPLRFISPTSFGSRFSTGSSFPCPFLAMFQIGFLYVSLSSLGQWFPRISFGGERGGGDNSRVTNSRFEVRTADDVSPLVWSWSRFISLSPALRADGPSRVIISVSDQKLMVMGNGAKLATYPVSTSKFGLGDNWGRMTTPLGFLQVAEKIGDHAPVGAVFRNRRFTGEILKPNAPGRDPVITSIIWLRGLKRPTRTPSVGASIFTARRRKS